MKEEIRERGKEGRKASVVAGEIEAERRRKAKEKPQRQGTLSSAILHQIIPA